MPRRTRTRQARRAEARARQERDEAYAELEQELHREWQERRPVGNGDAAENLTANQAMTEADAPQPE